jgi:hypothetical protein
MYARVTTLQIDPARLGEIPAKLNQVGPASEALPGIVDVYFAWRGDGQGTVTAIFNSKADADAALPKIQAIWGELGGLLKGPPSVNAFDNVVHLVG